MNQHGNNVYWHKPSVSSKDRRETYNYRSCVIWFTGLSGAGKSTLANALCKRLHEHGVRSYVLDGDNIRHGLNRNLGFSPEDRQENIRRISEVAKLFVDAGLLSLTAFISPYRQDRDKARALLGEGEFIEVYVKCSLDECARRDPKGIYEKARAGLIKEFTGLTAPYEEPTHPEIVLETDKATVEECSEKLFVYLVKHGYVAPAGAAATGR